MITPEMYLMGRDKDFPLDMLQARNMAELLAKVNWLLGTLNIKATVSSGYRPSAINKSIGGAKMSTHTVCAGIDIAGQELGLILQKNPALLEECDLYLESPSATPRWTHLDLKKRKNRVFYP
jgi:hypothetical protein